MAQQGIIVPSTSSSEFPGCALSCTTLLNAQDLCYPPNQPASTQLAYDQCFCTSSLLAAFYSTPDVVCAAECTIRTDRTILQAWYTSFCRVVSTGVDPVTQTLTSATAMATVASTSTGSTIPTITLTSPPQESPSNDSPSWISTHWRWVVMLAVLAVGLSALAVFLTWLKRRHHRKVEARRAVASGFQQDPEKRPGLNRRATPDLWGPHQMMQATEGYQYTTEGVTDRSTRPDDRVRHVGLSKDVDAIEVAEIQPTDASTKSMGRRARPSELETNARLIGAADRRSKSRDKRRMTEKEVEASLRGQKRSQPG